MAVWPECALLIALGSPEGVEEEKQKWATSTLFLLQATSGPENMNICPQGAAA